MKPKIEYLEKRYWVLIDDKVAGPAEKNAICAMPGFTDKTMVCPEGTEKWDEAGKIFELTNDEITALEDTPVDLEEKGILKRIERVKNPALKKFLIISFFWGPILLLAALLILRIYVKDKDSSADFNPFAAVWILAGTTGVLVVLDIWNSVKNKEFAFWEYILFTVVITAGCIMLLFFAFVSGADFNLTKAVSGIVLIIVFAVLFGVMRWDLIKSNELRAAFLTGCFLSFVFAVTFLKESVVKIFTY